MKINIFLYLRAHVWKITARLGSTCRDSQSRERIPADSIAVKTTRLVCGAFNCSVWSANDSSQRARTHSDLCFYFPQSAGSHGCRPVWCLVPRDVNQHSFNFHPGGCGGSLNWLPMQLSRLTCRSVLLHWVTSAWCLFVCLDAPLASRKRVTLIVELSWL